MGVGLERLKLEVGNAAAELTFTRLITSVNGLDHRLNSHGHVKKSFIAWLTLATVILLQTVPPQHLLLTPSAFTVGLYT